MIVRCPECGRKGKLDDGFAGKRVSCPACAVTFVAEAVNGTAKQTKWYYAVGDEKKGPVNQQVFDSLVKDGTIGAETLVWCKGMDNWLAYNESRMSLAAGDQVCSECLKSFQPSKMMDHEGRLVCERCKLALLHKKHELQDEANVQPGDSSGLVSGGLGSRFMAKIIDMIFMLAIGGMVEGVSRKFFSDYYVAGTLNNAFAITLVVNMLLGVFYITWFVGKFGATPGKMVARLKIVNGDGAKIGYGLAFGRYCGEFIVVALTLMIGYLVALFDRRRRTLHDRLCNTWVVKA
ncbi:MAG: RDD family protein [Proteobacteria bacterium]|nr:RDD family protein [Pseudomonadota bacterium]MBU1737546.1 RDD family protein [Pseudomonadota bacterium]